MSVNFVEGREFFEFGPFELDVAGRVLSRGGVPVPLAPKSFDVLVHLVRNAGCAVSRDELLTAVWPDVVVSDGTLTQAVFVVRRALGDAEEGRFLETVPRVGYRFTRDVRMVPRPPAPLVASTPVPAGQAAEPVAIGAPAAKPSPAAKRLVSGALLVLLLAAGALAFQRLRRTGTARDAALLSVVREIAVPPDATELLGRTKDTVVLGAPGALYLIPADGAHPAVRVPLGEGEIAADRLVDGEILVAKDRTLVFRDPLTRRDRPAGRLPATASRLLVSPSGGFAAIRAPDAVEVVSLASSPAVRVLRVEAKESANEALALSDRFFAHAPGRGRPVRAFALPSGAPVLEAPLEETRVTALAIEDASERLAAGGAFDGVVLYRLSGGTAPERFRARGWTRSLAFVPDHPTLVASGRLGLAAYRPGRGVVEEHDMEARSGIVRATADGLLVLSPERQRLTVVAYRGFPPLATVPASGAPLWALEHAGGALFAGGRDGRLYALETANGALRSEAVHTDGIPSLLRDGDLLASASDDKTVAVWSLPGPKLVSRTRAHAFLVNDLALAPACPGGPRLLTSSSDGTLKWWSWPALAPRETIDLAAAAGEPVDAHAVWTSPDGSRVLAGTWNHLLFDLARGPGGWSARKVAVASRAVYRLVALPWADAVAAVGIRPHRVFLLDLSSSRLVPLETAALDVYAAAADAAAGELFVGGAGGASRYRVERATDGALRVRLWSRRHSGLDLLALARTSEGALWGGTDQGTLVRLDPTVMAGPSLADRLVNQN